MCVHVKAAKM